MRCLAPCLPDERRRCISHTVLGSRCELPLRGRRCLKMVERGHLEKALKCLDQPSELRARGNADCRLREACTSAHVLALDMQTIRLSSRSGRSAVQPPDPLCLTR